MQEKQMIDLDNICANADNAFWQEVVKDFPLTASGDFDFGLSFSWDKIVREVIIHWWWTNASHLYDLESVADGKVLQCDCVECMNEGSK